MESEILWAGNPSHVLETWLATQAQVVPYEKEPWVWANPKASPFSKATFWRLLPSVVKRCNLERVRTLVGRPGGPPIPGTLIRGRMHTCAYLKGVAQCGSYGHQGDVFTPWTEPVSLAESYGSITNGTSKNKKETNTISCVRFAHKKKRVEEFQEEVSGEFDLSESAQEKAAKWQKLQNKDANGAIADSIATLTTGKLTSPRLADLWKLLFCSYTGGYAKNLGVKERASLYAWKNEFYTEFPPDVLFGEFLRDVIRDYQKIVKPYVLKSSGFKDGPDLPNVPWMYHHREHVIKCWLASAKTNEFKGATLS